MSATIDNRYVEVKQAGYTPSSDKPATDAYMYTFDFTGWLAAEDTVTTAQASSTGSGGTAPTLGIPTVVTGGMLVTLLCSAGTGGWRGDVTVKATTQKGQIKSQAVRVHITPDSV